MITETNEITTDKAISTELDSLEWTKELADMETMAKEFMETELVEELVLSELSEYRCYLSKRLLCKATGNGQIEIINPENRALNYVWPSRVHQDIWPRGQEFVEMASDLRCSKCWRLQARAIGTDLVVEIKCKYCHETTLYKLEDIESAKLSTMSTVQRTNYEKEKNIKMNKYKSVGVYK